jgi:hypothetical protein
LALNDVKSLIAGAQEYLPQLIELQEGQHVDVTYHAEVKQVRMHANERTSVNKGVLRFSDTPYEIGLNENADGTVDLHYDSWVSGGKLRTRINGKCRTNEPANMKVCQSLWRAKQAARREGTPMRVGPVEGRLMAFVPA